MKIDKLASTMLAIILIITIGNISYGANTTNSNNMIQPRGVTNTASTEEENEEDGLASLKIEGVELSPEFETDKYSYEVKYIGESESLQIEAIATEVYYGVEIAGNKNLKEGENLITILVSDTNGKNVATYQLTVNKSLVDEEEVAREEQAKLQEKQRKLIIIISCVIGAIVFLIIIILIIKKIAE